MVTHAKFYLFDAGVYRGIRPRGPLDRPSEADGDGVLCIPCEDFLRQLRPGREIVQPVS